MGMLVELPEGEQLDLEEVHDEPWWAFNYYLGELRSRVVVNSDQQTTAADLVTLAAHEVYPGHHTERVVKEQLLVREQGFLEESIQLVPTPQSLVGEGIAELGLEVIIDDELEHELEATLVGPGSRGRSRAVVRDRPRPPAAAGDGARRRPDDPRARALDRRGTGALRALGDAHTRARGERRAVRDRPDVACLRDHLFGRPAT